MPTVVLSGRSHDGTLLYNLTHNAFQIRYDYVYKSILNIVRKIPISLKNYSINDLFSSEMDRISRNKVFFVVRYFLTIYGNQ